MIPAIKQLGPGDEAILELLAKEDADFDLEGRGGPLQPLDSVAAQKFLSNPNVLFWVTPEADTILGFLYCLLVPLRSGAGSELLLYEIGVRSACRKQGVGRALLTHMEDWMRKNEVGEVWVLADNAVAVEFYRGCGFKVEDEQPVYMTRAVRT